MSVCGFDAVAIVGATVGGGGGGGGGVEFGGGTEPWAASQPARDNQT